MFLKSTTFPIIEHISDILPKIKDMPEIRHITHDNGYSSLCYMISNKNTFSGENAAFAKECRGITFYPSGKIAHRHLHKFFNVNEREDTLKHLLDWNSVNNVSDKRDGSTIYPILVKDKILLKSKKSFYSDVANLANEFIKNKTQYQEFCKDLLLLNMSPIFEFTSNKARIVLNYPFDQLTLIQIRHTITGEYLTPIELRNYARKYYINVVDYHPYSKTSLEYFFNEAEHRKDFEGFVFQFNNGEMVKLKSKWYLDLHHSIVFINERNVAEMVLDETLDDFKSYLRESNSDASIERVEQIETQISEVISNFQNEIEAIVNQNKDLQRKEFALKYNKHKLFGVLMPCFIGQEVNYKEWFRKYKLKELFTTQQV